MNKDTLLDMLEEIKREYEVTGWTENLENTILLILKDCYDYGKDYGWQYDLDAYIESRLRRER